MTEMRDLQARVSPLAKLCRTVAGSTPGAILIGLVGTALTFGLVYALTAADDFARSVFFVAPTIAAVQTVLFFLGGSLLLGKLGALSMERAVLAAPLQRILGTGHPEGSIDRADAAAVLGRLDDLGPPFTGSVVVGRIEKSMRRLHITGSTGELGTILTELSRLDEERFDSRHTMVRFLLAVIPIVGFIGTVLGISLAISGFPDLLGASEGMDALRKPIAEVTSQLGVAFNTTLLALVQAGLLMFFQSLVQRREEDFLSDVNEFSIKEILNRVQMQSEGVQFKEAIEREMQDLRLVMAEQNEELLLSFQELISGMGGKR